MLCFRLSIFPFESTYSPLVSCFKWYLWFYCFFVPTQKDHLFRETTVLFWQSSLPNFMSSKVSTLWLFDYEGLTLEWNNFWKSIQMRFHEIFFIFSKKISWKHRCMKIRLLLQKRYYLFVRRYSKLENSLCPHLVIRVWEVGIPYKNTFLANSIAVINWSENYSDHLLSIDHNYFLNACSH